MKLADQKIDKIRELWDANIAIMTIAEVVDISSSSIDRARRAYAFPSRHSGHVQVATRAFRETGCLERAANAVAERFGAGEAKLPRAVINRRKPAKDRKEPAKPEPRADAIKSPRWTPDLDRKVFETGGKYADVEKLSKKIDRGVNSILARWHQLRP